MARLGLFTGTTIWSISEPALRAVKLKSSGRLEWDRWISIKRRYIELLNKEQKRGS